MGRRESPLSQGCHSWARRVKMDVLASTLLCRPRCFPSLALNVELARVHREALGAPHQYPPARQPHHLWESSRTPFRPPGLVLCSYHPHSSGSRITPFQELLQETWHILTPELRPHIPSQPWPGLVTGLETQLITQLGHSTGEQGGMCTVPDAKVAMGFDIQKFVLKHVFLVLSCLG